MKLILSRKVNAPKTRGVTDAVNHGFGNTYTAVADNEVEAFVSSQTARGFVCHEFQYTATWQAETNVVKSEAA